MAVSEGEVFDERRLSDQEMDRFPAKNQVTVFGYACNQTAACMPMPIWAAHKLARRLTSVRLQKILPYLGPDGKSQVGIEYRERKPHRIHSISLVASQSKEAEPSPQRLSGDIREYVIKPAFNGDEIQPDGRTEIFINPDGPFVVGGPALHSGLTGRKNAIDTYGEFARHSGAALSGKDPTRIDRVGAYAARYAAKNAVVAGLAAECEVLLSYSIGLARPVSIQVQTFGTGHLPDE
jgi:S-adenosylmethionine synthetase